MLKGLSAGWPPVLSYAVIPYRIVRCPVVSYGIFLIQKTILSMTLQEIIAAENCNTDRIYLYPEGVFWKAYERSAFAFVRRISRYKITKRFIKYLDTEIVSLGFPDTSRTRVLGDRPVQTGPYGMLVLDGGTIDPVAYVRWKEAIPLVAARTATTPPPAATSVAPPPTFGKSGGAPRSGTGIASIAPLVVASQPVATENRTSVVEAVLRDLRNFSVENATPLECLLFVSSLKKQLNGSL